MQMAFPFTTEGTEQKKYFPARVFTVLTYGQHLSWMHAPILIVNMTSTDCDKQPVIWGLMKNIKFHRGRRQTPVLILRSQPPVGSLDTALTVLLPRGVAGEWEIGRRDQNHRVNPYPQHLSPSTPWLLVVMNVDGTLTSHHPDPHLYLYL